MNGEYVRSGVVIAVKTHRSVKVAWTEKDKPVTPTTLYQAKVIDDTINLRLWYTYRSLCIIVTKTFININTRRA